MYVCTHNCISVRQPIECIFNPTFPRCRCPYWYGDWSPLYAVAVVWMMRNMENESFAFFFAAATQFLWCETRLNIKAYWRRLIYNSRSIDFRALVKCVRLFRCRHQLVHRKTNLVTGLIVCHRYNTFTILLNLYYSIKLQYCEIFIVLCS